MPSRETKPVSERRTELSDRRDIVRRLLFMLVVIGGPAGLALALFGATHHQLAPIIAGGCLVMAAAVAWWRRHVWGAQATVDELKANPFKAGREPKE